MALPFQGKALFDASNRLIERRKLWSLLRSGVLAADLPDGSPSRNAVSRFEPKADASDWAINSGSLNFQTDLLAWSSR